MLNPLKQNPRLFSGRSRDISCCGRPKVCVKGQKVVPVYCFKMCTTLYLYSSGCSLDGNPLKAIRLWEMVRYGFQVYVCYANRSIWSIRCHTSAEASILISLCICSTITAHQIQSISLTFLFLPFAYDIEFPVTPGTTKSFLLVSQDNLNPQYSLYRSK